MYRVSSGLLLAIMLLSACSEPVSPGSAQLPDSTLVQVLVELHLADAALQDAREARPALRDSVLFYYGVSDADFLLRMSAFEQNPEELVAIYNTVLDRLNAERLP